MKAQTVSGGLLLPTQLRTENSEPSESNSFRGHPHRLSRGKTWAALLRPQTKFKFEAVFRDVVHSWCGSLCEN